MLVYMVCGYGLVKFNKGESSHAKSLSGLLVYVCTPAMIVNAFQKLEYAPEYLVKSLLFFVVSLAIQLLFFAILFLVFRKKYKDPKFRILSAGGILGNCGFFGYPLLTGIFPNEPIAGCYSTIFMVSMNLLVFTIGVYLITTEKKYISIKSALFNPPVLGIVIAIPLYILQFKFNSTVGDTVALFAKMSTPLCMIVLGMRLASMSIKKTFTSTFAYATSAIKLIAFPLFAYLCVAFLPFVDDVFKVSMYVLCATPCAAVILTQAELHECEQKLAANVVLLSTLLSLITIPVMLLIV